MKSLIACAPTTGMQAMQSINRKVYKSLFMILLMGLVPVSTLVSVYSAVFLTRDLQWILITAGVLYCTGVFGVTAMRNVPMNHRLDTLVLGSAEAGVYWPEYVRGWVRWNHVRWVTALGASTCYMVAAVHVAAQTG